MFLLNWRNFIIPKKVGVNVDWPNFFGMVKFPQFKRNMNYNIFARIWATNFPLPVRV